MEINKSIIFKSLSQNDRILKVVATTQDPDSQGDIIMTKGYNNDYLMNQTDHKVRFEHSHDVGEIQKSVSILDATVPYVEQEFRLDDTDIGKSMLTFVKEDIIERVSVAGKGSDVYYKSNYRYIGKLDPHETTLCMMGVNPNAKVLKSVSAFAGKVQLAKSVLTNQQFNTLFPEDSGVISLLINQEVEQLRKSVAGHEEEIRKLNESYQSLQKSNLSTLGDHIYSEEFIEELAEQLGLKELLKIKQEKEKADRVQWLMSSLSGA